MIDLQTLRPAVSTAQQSMLALHEMVSEAEGAQALGTDQIAPMLQNLSEIEALTREMMLLLGAAHSSAAFAEEQAALAAIAAEEG